MQLKKLLQGSAFALVAAACAIAVPSVVKAEDVAPGSMADAGLKDVGYDAYSATLTITGQEATEGTPASGTPGKPNYKPAVPATPGTQEIQVGFGKVKNGVVTVSTWDTYDGDSATVDLSKLSNVKENYVVISTPGNGKMIVKIPAAPKKIKAKFNAAEGVLEAGSGDTATAAKLEVSTVADDGTVTTKSAGNYEFRTAYSSRWINVEQEIWNDDSSKITSFKLTDLSLYQQEGAKLFVRVKGTPTKLTDDGEGNEVWAQSTSEKLKYGDVDTGVYVAGTLPGKEAKVSIAAKAKGPKPTADYTKGTVKFAKDCEYRIATSEKIYKNKDNKEDTPEANLKEATSAPTTPTTIKKLYEDVGIVLTGDDVDLTNVEKATIEVRKAAKGTKAASKWGILDVELPKELTTAYYGLDADGKTNKVYSDAEKTTEVTDEDEIKKFAIIQGEVDKVPTSDELAAVKKDEPVPYGGKGVAESTFRESDSKPSVLKVEYTTSSKKADAQPAIQITNSGDKTYEIVVKKETDATKISDTDKPVKVTSKKPVTIKNVEDGACVFVRIAGDKKSTTWVTQYGNLGTIDVKKEAKGTQEETSTP